MITTHNSNTIITAISGSNIDGTQKLLLLSYLKLLKTTNSCEKLQNDSVNNDQIKIYQKKHTTDDRPNTV